MTGKTRTFLAPAKPTEKTAEGGALLDGRYRIVRLLGEGGMGAVYLASHVGLGRDVAIKFLHAEFVSREDIVGRFQREAQAAAAIRHKNIIDVFDVGMSPQGEPFLVMEYLEGESLAGLLKRVGPLGLGAAGAVMEPALQALQAAHRKGIVHRDLKPDNIFLAYQEGEPPVETPARNGCPCSHRPLRFVGLPLAIWGRRFLSPADWPVTSPHHQGSVAHRRLW